MTQHVRGGLGGVCVQPTTKCGLCLSCLKDRMGEVRELCLLDKLSVMVGAVPRGRETQPPRSGCESALRPGMRVFCT